ncbi:MAG: Lrp/AsnC family transcriptional regulator [Syntrophomonadaceae bacterium]|nr:Lrp/AsnC family transcriptional regulator [Syntrophomonadaceae bacterium]
MTGDLIDRNIISLLQGDLPLESRPFYKLAQQLQISEQEIVDRIIKMQQMGIIRRWGAVLRHRQAGYMANAMVAWKVEASAADRAGRLMAEFKAISHCYLRQVPNLFAYNLFAMMHAHDEEELQRIIDEVSKRTGINDYAVIRSLKEYKKVSMQYI